MGSLSRIWGLGFEICSENQDLGFGLGTFFDKMRYPGYCDSRLPTSASVWFSPNKSEGVGQSDMLIGLFFSFGFDQVSHRELSVSRFLCDCRISEVIITFDSGRSIDPNFATSSPNIVSFIVLYFLRCLASTS